MELTTEAAVAVVVSVVLVVVGVLEVVVVVVAAALMSRVLKTISAMVDSRLFAAIPLVRKQ